MAEICAAMDNYHDAAAYSVQAARTAADPRKQAQLLHDADLYSLGVVLASFQTADSQRGGKDRPKPRIRAT